jgi:thiol-disulfide isomerase/thioredoxin
MTLRRQEPARPLAAAVLAAGCALLLSCAASGADLSPYAAAPQAPPVRLQDPAGREHRLEDYRGNLVLVNFWASWCPPCIREMPSIRRLAERLDGRPFRVLAVNVRQSAAMARRFRSSLGEAAIILADDRGEVFDAWGGQIMPTSFLVDAEGRLRYRAYGEVEWDGPEAIELIERLMPDRNGAEPEPISASR